MLRDVFEVKEHFRPSDHAKHTLGLKLNKKCLKLFQMARTQRVNPFTRLRMVIVDSLEGQGLV